MFEKLDVDLDGDPILMAGPAPAADIDAIEAFAGFPLSPSYREFLKKYGAAIVGPYPVYGWGASEAMSANDSSVIGVTERFRLDGWQSATDKLVVSMDHAGNAITLNDRGHVQRFDHDSGIDEVISESFEGFLDWCMSIGK